ncbi:uncharacterized protein A1O9_06858 [Exophiala aquamarina CBS 119918]|uniref:Nitronate monooxygenase domain-containing protein n=1 Tax=Exophiala aquamarina CBS 119918 TaxID=1182545 RepID=A0A072P964_9EURO|nr:uncharacterized protein A1O9_06858 [Exophiala aquamarina CBS 119918]KEF56669.1 hypothetical protein A1O9_06858 [Exophiala aquamarina CBS 119918]
MARTLKEQLPWTLAPLVVNAPMGGFAGGALAAAVTQAGGLGQIGAVMDMGELERELKLAKEILSKSNDDSARPSTLPIGVGLLPFILQLEHALPVLAKYQPAVVWLFAAKELDDYAVWTRQLRAALPDTSVWIQVGSASAALRVAQAGTQGADPSTSDPKAQPDALVLQGSDAGGHGFERGASIVALVPETLDLLRSHSLGSMPILAAGGIADARGAAAAFALGASGVVLGTRFLAAHETMVPHPAYRESVLAARDGANNTVRSKLFDNVRGPNIWPEAYDGRSLVTQSYTDFVGGTGVDEVRRRHDEAAKARDKGFGGDGENGRANVWAGASVGLVNRTDDARDIVREVRDGVDEVLAETRARL